MCKKKKKKGDEKLHRATQTCNSRGSQGLEEKGRHRKKSPSRAKTGQKKMTRSSRAYFLPGKTTTYSRRLETALETATEVIYCENLTMNIQLYIRPRPLPLRQKNKKTIMIKPCISGGGLLVLLLLLLLFLLLRCWTATTGGQNRPKTATAIA